MIGYPADDATLRALVDAHAPTWRAKATTRTTKLLKAGRFDEKTSIWADVKEVFMRLQCNKCAFCERQFETPDYGRIEFDLEHFRPKSSVQPWPDATRHAGLQYPFATGAESPGGYYWLAYDLRNYAASCKVCNTTFKSNWFPVGGARATQPGQPLADEQAWLCHPLDAGDADPEGLVTFVATTAVPAGATERDRRRGQVIIDFFGLNRRQQLHRERARMIALFGGALAARHAGQMGPEDAQLLARLGAPTLPHAACLRAFERSWHTDPALAQRIHAACRAYAVDDGSAPPPQPATPAAADASP